MQPYVEGLGDALAGLPGLPELLEGAAVASGSPALAGLPELLEGAAVASGSPALAGALSAFLGDESERIDGFVTRIAAAWQGVVAATSAYCEGDLEMARTAQAAAVVAVVPPELPAGVV